MKSVWIFYFLCLLFSQIYCGPLECGFCEAAAEVFLLDPTAVQDLDQLLEQICSELPDILQSSCNKSVSALAVFLNNINLFLRRQEEFTSYSICTMVNQCDIDCCISGAPEQVHIAFGNDPHTSISVMWVTRSNSLPSVKYGLSSSSLTMTQQGRVTTYTPGYWQGFINIVLLNNLTAGTTYYYQVGSDVSGWSQVYSFTTESKDSRNEVTRIAYIGDMGTQNSTNTMAALSNLVANKKINWIMHNGDISYADGFQQRWDIYFRQFESTIANSPYMVTLGNHEIGVIAALNLSIGYVHRFTLPGPYSISLDYENLYYSWNYANIHFISIDTESTLDIAYLSPKQIAWIEQDLAQVDRTLYPWVIVYGHRPLYCSGNSDDCSEMAFLLRDGIEDILYKYNVNIVLGAHRHNYERFWPVYKGLPEKTYDKPRSPVHIVNGVGGNREGYAHINDADVLPSSVVHFERWGYGLFTVYNDTTLEYTYTDSETGDVLDSFVLTRA